MLNNKEENEYYAQWVIASGVDLHCMLRVICILADEVTYDAVTKGTFVHAALERVAFIRARQCGQTNIVLGCSWPMSMPIQIEMKSHNLSACERRFMIKTEKPYKDTSWRNGTRGRKGKIKYRRI